MYRKLLLVIVFSSLPAVAYPSADTIGSNGILSSGLGLDGSGVKIGQVENLRPGKLPLDSGSHTDSTISPAQVYFRDQQETTQDADTSSGPDYHAEWVAGAMISSDATRRGVAPLANLYSAALQVDQTNGQIPAALAAQQLVTDQHVKAVNFSFGQDRGSTPLEGNSLLTLFQDWSAHTKDALYVDAGSETGHTDSVPTDNFNGMTIGMTAKASDGVYRLVDPSNVITPQDLGGRTYVSLLAPGRDVQVRGPAGSNSTQSGTSFAAPHVTGTVALLQQYANTQQNLHARGWGADSNKHEVMKAVLLNSADKVKDDGMFTLPNQSTPVPQGYLLGMDKTVI
jgi:subtilisin family serine protease